MQLSKKTENKVVKEALDYYISNNPIIITKFDNEDILKEIRINSNKIPKSGLITYKKNYQSYKESEMRYILFPGINKFKMRYYLIIIILTINNNLFQIINDFKLCSLL